MWYLSCILPKWISSCSIIYYHTSLEKSKTSVGEICTANVKTLFNAWPRVRYFYFGTVGWIWIKIIVYHWVWARAELWGRLGVPVNKEQREKGYRFIVQRLSVWSKFGKLSRMHFTSFPSYSWQTIILHCEQTMVFCCANFSLDN